MDFAVTAPGGVVPEGEVDAVALADAEEATPIVVAVARTLGAVDVDFDPVHALSPRLYPAVAGS